MVDSKIRSRVRGAIIGTAIGDALGMPFEGLSPETIEEKFKNIRSMTAPVKNTVGHRIHNLKRGQWTDDTQLMLAIGESIVSKKHIDFNDIAKRHVLCLNDARGWGKTTLVGINRIKNGTNWWSSAVQDGAGNGTPMKMAPIGILLALNKIDMFEANTAVINISRMTHGDPRPAIAGIIQADIISRVIKGGKESLRLAIHCSEGLAFRLELSLDKRSDILCRNKEGYKPLSSCIHSALSMANSGEDLSKIREKVGASSFVVESFPLMLAAILKYSYSSEECLVQLVKQGGDSDTTCAMAGAILGAAHGLSSFPSRWRRPLEGYERLINLADNLCNL